MAVATTLENGRYDVVDNEVDEDEEDDEDVRRDETDVENAAKSGMLRY